MKNPGGILGMSEADGDNLTSLSMAAFNSKPEFAGYFSAPATSSSPEQTSEKSSFVRQMTTGAGGTITPSSGVRGISIPLTGGGSERAAAKSAVMTQASNAALSLTTLKAKQAENKSNIAQKSADDLVKAADAQAKLDREIEEEDKRNADNAAIGDTFVRLSVAQAAQPVSLVTTVAASSPATATTTSSSMSPTATLTASSPASDFITARDACLDLYKIDNDAADARYRAGYYSERRVYPNSSNCITNYHIIVEAARDKDPIFNKLSSTYDKLMNNSMPNDITTNLAAYSTAYDKFISSPFFSIYTGKKTDEFKSKYKPSFLETEATRVAGIRASNANAISEINKLTPEQAENKRFDEIPVSCDNGSYGRRIKSQGAAGCGFGQFKVSVGNENTCNPYSCADSKEALISRLPRVGNFEPIQTSAVLGYISL